jgi:hypothetical protein
MTVKNPEQTTWLRMKPVDNVILSPRLESLNPNIS